MNWETEHMNQSRYAWELEKINPESVIDEITPSPLQQVLRRECLGGAFKEMAKLPHREVKIILLRDYEGRTLEETRQHIINMENGIPVSRERIRQLEKRALGKVREELIRGGYELE